MPVNIVDFGRFGRFGPVGPAEAIHNPKSTRTYAVGDNFELTDRMSVLRFWFQLRKSYPHWDRVHHKLLSLQRVVLSNLDEARKSLLVNVIESYLQLDEVEVVQFNELVASSDAEEVREMMTIYEERGIEKGILQGIEQGIEQGITRGKRELLLRQMRSKFGELPDKVVQKLEQLTDNDLLDELSVRLLMANTLEEMGLEMI
jgi:hypothetical protein